MREIKKILCILIQKVRERKKIQIVLFGAQFLDPVWWLARSKARVLGFDRSPGRPGQVFFLKKSKRRRFSKKKQKSTGCNRVFDRVLPGQSNCNHIYIRFFISLFFLQLGLVPAPGRPARPGFKTMVWRGNFTWRVIFCPSKTPMRVVSLTIKLLKKKSTKHD